VQIYLLNFAVRDEKPFPYDHHPHHLIQDIPLTYDTAPTGAAEGLGGEGRAPATGGMCWARAFTHYNDDR
jgi:hypothetical protein